MSWRKFAYRLYWPMEKLIAPGLVFSQGTYENVLCANVHADSLWLDIGCGHNILPPWREPQEKLLAQIPRLIVGLDADLPSLQRHKSIDYKIEGDVKKLPFKDCSFSLITANMVFEHLHHPVEQLREIARVLKPGGSLVFHTPNALGYATVLARLTPEWIKKKAVYFLQKRKEEDVFPTHYRINSSRQITTLAHGAGFKVKDIFFIPSTALFVMIPPLALLELFWIRLTSLGCLKHLRTNIIAHLVKRGTYV